MQFRTWLENNYSALDILNMVRQSPNMPQRSDEEWQRYAEQFGIEGDFHMVDYPAITLGEMVDNHRLYLSKYDPQEVESKMQTRQFNPIILTDTPSRRYVIDGTHSLVAAARLAAQMPPRQRHTLTVKVIKPVGMQI